MIANAQIGIRWTIGDVSDRGFDALRLSTQGGVRLFGPDAAYVVCVNKLTVDAARAKAGDLPPEVTWRYVASDEVPAFLTERFDARMAEGVGWKLAPMRVFPDRWEVALDNDCVLYDRPAALDAWLAAADAKRTLFAADVRACFGQFAGLAGPGPLNSGIRGLPPGFDMGAAMRAVLAEADAAAGRRLVLTSELDEQGLQAAAVVRFGNPFVVSTDDVSICSPFHPHQPEPGRCGSHFVGLNSRHLPWDYYGRPGTEVRTGHYDARRDAVAAKVGLPPIHGGR